MKKSFIRTLAIAACIGLTLPVSSFAYAVDTRYEFPDPETRADISVTISSPEYYEGVVEFFCGGESFDRKIKSGESVTTVTFNVPKGVHHIEFMIPDDISDAMVLSYPTKLNTYTTENINLSITSAPSTYTYDEAELDVPQSPVTDNADVQYSSCDIYNALNAYYIRVHQREKDFLTAKYGDEWYADAACTHQLHE